MPRKITKTTDTLDISTYDPLGLVANDETINLVVAVEPQDRDAVAFLTTDVQVKGLLIHFSNPMVLDEGKLVSDRGANKVIYNINTASFTITSYTKEAFFAQLQAGAFKDMLGE